jgi:hydrogenase 3 maturation protease
MQNLKTQLTQKLNQPKRTFILCIGSEIIGDDAAGFLLFNELKDKLIPEKAAIMFASTSPESFTGAIKQFNPTHLIIFDAADFGKDPGTMQIIDPEDINGTSFSTHRLPTRIFINYVTKDTGCLAIVIGVQPKNLIFGTPICDEVKRAINELAVMLLDLTK